MAGGERRLVGVRRGAEGLLGRAVALVGHVEAGEGLAGGYEGERPHRGVVEDGVGAGRFGGAGA